MQVVDLSSLSDSQRDAAARLLIDSFVQMAPDAWPTMVEAREEIAGMLEDGKIALAAIDNGAVLGIVGAMHEYALVWELHPLAVKPDAQRKGIGSALVHVLEARVREQGGLTIRLGTDDEMGLTSLAGVDVYPDPLTHLHALTDVAGHPFVFYRKLGYVVVGLIPDANGFGKPDIMMAKRI